jgi:hypothetical protein
LSTKPKRSRFVAIYRLHGHIAHSFLQGNVQSTQEIVELLLDSNRNALLELDLKVRSDIMS